MKTSLQPFTCLVIDDEQKAVDLLGGLLSEFPYVHLLEKITDSETALKKIQQLQPDLVFLDIHMGNTSGIEILKLISEYHIHTHVVMVTAFSQYALDALQNSAMDYLLKPVSKIALEHTLQKFIEHKKHHIGLTQVSTFIESMMVRKISIPTAKGTWFYNPEEIIYLQAEGNYTNVYLTENREFLSSFHLGKLEEKLSLQQFIRISRSAIINRKYLLRVEKSKRKCCLSVNGEEIVLPISKGFSFDLL